MSAEGEEPPIRCVIYVRVVCCGGGGRGLLGPMWGCGGGGALHYFFVDPHTLTFTIICYIIIITYATDFTSK